MEKSPYEKLNRDHVQLRIQGNEIEAVSEVQSSSRCDGARDLAYQWV